MQITRCDICKQIIKVGDPKFYFAMKDTNEPVEPLVIARDIDAIKETIHKLKKMYDDIKVYEICEGCKKIIDYCLNLRIDELEKIQKEMENLDQQFNGGEDGKSS